MRRSDDMFLVVVSTIVGMIAVGLFVAGVAVLLVGTLGTEDGFFQGDPVSLSSDGNAVRTDALTLGADPGVWFPDGGAVRTRITVTPGAPDVPMFIGIAQSADLDRWLADAAQTSIDEVRDGQVEVDVRDGTATPAPPDDQAFWAVSSVGSDTRTLVWDDRFGDWELVIANADASPGVVATGEGAVQLRLANQVGYGMMGAALVLGLLGVVVYSTAVRYRRREDPDEPDDDRPTRLPVTADGPSGP